LIAFCIYIYIFIYPDFSTLFAQEPVTLNKITLSKETVAVKGKNQNYEIFTNNEKLVLGYNKHGIHFRRPVN